MAFLTLIVLLFGQHSSGEYRAFELNLTNQKNGTKRKVITTLDQYQYASYYPVAPETEVQYVKSWMCWERSDQFKKTCSPPPPKQKPESEGRTPANNL